MLLGRANQCGKYRGKEGLPAPISRVTASECPSAVRGDAYGYDDICAAADAR